MHQKSLITTFPPEIMCFIFKEMCISQLQDLDHVLARLPGSLEYGRECIFSAVHDDLDEDFDTFSMLKAVRTPGFFPYAVASVCQYWDEILSSNPAYWNVVVIFIDEMDRTQLHRLQAYFDRSGNSPIDVFIVRKEDTSVSIQTSILSEYKNVAAALGLLMPHFERCKSLHVHVGSSLSLPLLPKSFPSTPAILRHLSFTCETDVDTCDILDSKHDFLTDVLSFENIPANAPSFEFKPRLTSLALDGRNIQSALSNDASRSWISQLADLKVLSIGNYNPTAVSTITGGISPDTCEGSPLSLYRVFESFQECWNIEDLTFESALLDIRPGGNVYPDNSFAFECLVTLTMLNMDPIVIQEIFRVMDHSAQVLTFIRCPRLSAMIFPHTFMTRTLELESLDEQIDLVPFLKACECESLVIINSRCFSDEVLEAMSIQEGTNPNGGARFPCGNYLCNLHLEFDNSDPSYTVGALKKMIEARGEGVDYSLSSWSEVSEGMPLDRLTVTGQVPDLQPEDEAWFRARLSEFQWG